MVSYELVGIKGLARWFICHSLPYYVLWRFLRPCEAKAGRPVKAIYGQQLLRLAVCKASDRHV